MNDIYKILINQKSFLSHFIILTLLCPTFITGQILYQKSFASGNWPAGWTFEGTGTDSWGNPAEGNWIVSSSWQGNNPPPVAVFNWTHLLFNYEYSATTPAIDVDDNDTVKVTFYFSMDFYDSGSHDSLRVSYNGGSSWIDVMKIGKPSGVPNPWPNTETFLAIVNDDSTLQIRWTAYGTNSWAIDG